jgi:hypothetical protein
LCISRDYYDIGHAACDGVIEDGGACSPREARVEQDGDGSNSGAAAASLGHDDAQSNNPPKWESAITVTCHGCHQVPAVRLQ